MILMLIVIALLLFLIFLVLVMGRERFVSVASWTLIGALILIVYLYERGSEIRTEVTAPSTQQSVPTVTTPAPPEKTETTQSPKGTGGQKTTTVPLNGGRIWLSPQ